MGNVGALRINAASPLRGRERSDEPRSLPGGPQLLRGGLAAPHSIRQPDARLARAPRFFYFLTSHETIIEPAA